VEQEHFGAAVVAVVHLMVFLETQLLVVRVEVEVLLVNLVHGVLQEMVAQAI
jgi:hypothetical protein